MALVGPSAGRKGIPEEEKAKTNTERKEQIASGGYGSPGKRVSALLANEPGVAGGQNMALSAKCIL
jgi:hypothetical protein